MTTTQPHPGTQPPGADEYAPYYGKYVSMVPAGDVIETLRKQVETTLGLLRGLPAAAADSRYAPDKWSLKEVVGHVTDAERIFAYRALCFARSEKAALPGMEPDDYVRAASFDARSLADLADELEQVRRATVCLFRGLDAGAWARRGTASGNPVSVRALAYIIAGHEQHHRQILESRYLGAKAV